jgi:hypothetical protein
LDLLPDNNTSTSVKQIKTGYRRNSYYDYHYANMPSKYSAGTYHLPKLLLMSTQLPQPRTVTSPKHQKAHPLISRLQASPISTNHKCEFMCPVSNPTNHNTVTAVAAKIPKILQRFPTQPKVPFTVGAK